MLSEGNGELAEIKSQVASAKAEYVKIKKLIRNMLETQINVLDETTEDFEVESK